jgi:hypothetical protein
VALDHTLAVIGATRPEEMAERLGFTRGEFQRRHGVWTARVPLFILTLRTAEHGYFADEEQGWALEPRRYLDVGFRLDKFRSLEAVAAVSALVERALATGGEDMAHLGPDFHVRLERVDGVVRRFPGGVWEPEGIVRREWSTYYVGDGFERIDEGVISGGDDTAQRWVDRYGPEAARGAAALLLAIAAEPGHPLRPVLEDDSGCAWLDPQLEPIFAGVARRVADRLDRLAP